MGVLEAMAALEADWAEYNRRAAEREERERQLQELLSAEVDAAYAALTTALNTTPADGRG